MCVYVCVCVCERERERVCVRERERKRVWCFGHRKTTTCSRYQLSWLAQLNRKMHDLSKRASQRSFKPDCKFMVNPVLYSRQFVKSLQEHTHTKAYTKAQKHTHAHAYKRIHTCTKTRTFKASRVNLRLIRARPHPTVQHVCSLCLLLGRL